LESVVLVVLVVLDEKLLLVSSVAVGKNHSLTVSGWVSEGNAQVLVNPGVELHVDGIVHEEVLSSD